MMNRMMFLFLFCAVAACATAPQVNDRPSYGQPQFQQGVFMPAQAGPGWDVNGYFHQKSVADRSATTCGGGIAFGNEYQGLRFHYLNGVDPRANRVVAYKDGVGLLDTTGCFFQPAPAALADLDGNGLFDFPYQAAGVHGVLSVPMQAGETVLLYFLACDQASLCRVVEVKRYPYSGKRSYMDAGGGWTIEKYR
jgi:hypothetical protein